MCHLSGALVRQGICHRLELYDGDRDKAVHLAWPLAWPRRSPDIRPRREPGAAERSP